MYMLLKNLHITLATLSISGFVLRGVLMMRASPLLRHRVARIAPHVIDTLFLATGIGLIMEINLAVLQNAWLVAKLLGLVLYIVLGMIAMRFGRTPQVRTLAFVAAVAMFAYIVGAALSKSPLSWLAFPV